MECVLVARLALHRRGLEVGRLVAITAPDGFMASDQWKSRFVVVEIAGLFPVGFIVALGAIGAEATFMDVVFLMAANTRQRQVILGRLIAVTALASDLAVRATQRKFGLVVVERGRRPVARLVAVGAIGPEGSLMHVVGLMTANTGEREAGVLSASMAGPAFGLGVLAGQRKFGGGVVECRRFFPVRGLMAFTAAGAEFAFMRIVLAVAGVAGDRGGPEFSLFSVARGASEPDMATGEWEFTERVVEQGGVEEDDAGITAHMVGVAASALRCRNFR